MVTIISKQDGPRKGEAELKDKLRKNRGTIEGIVSTLSGTPGRLGQQQQPQKPIETSTTTVSYRKTSNEGEAKPYVRISVNGRVVLVDFETGSQLHHVGELRGKKEAARFLVASKENGFFAPLEQELRDKLKGLDGRPVPDGAAEDTLKKDIEAALGLAG